MALIFADGFDHYGGDVARMREGVYAQLEGVSLVTGRKRTGTHAAQIWVIENDSGMRRVMPTAGKKFNIAFAYDINALPTDAFSLGIMQFLDAFNGQMLTISVMPTGAITVRQGRRDGTVLAMSAPETVLPGSYMHFELALRNSNLEIRINGDTVINMTDLALSSDVAQVYIGGMYGYPKLGGLGVFARVDDLVAADDVGTSFNTWIGDKKVYLQKPDRDGTATDWTPSVGTEAWPILDNVPPIDSQYITAKEVDEKTSVGLEPLPEEVVSISGVYLVGRIWKNDAGTAKVSIGVDSGSASAPDADISVTNAPRYYGRAFTEDPDTLMPWTASGLNDAFPSLTRTE